VQLGVTTGSRANWNSRISSWPLNIQSLLDCSQEHRLQPSDLGARMTYLADATVPERETKGPDCDFALPIT